MEQIADSGIAVEVSTAGLRKPVGEIYPDRAFLEMVVDAGNPIALSSDAHTPEQLGYEYDRALELLADVGVTEIAVFEHRAVTLEPIGAS
jgi:histidinol-phosphatase (PHP family)